MALKLFVGRELPVWSLFWLNSVGAARDLSAGWTFVVTVRQAGTDTTVTATVTANATPTADTGSAADIPTLTVAPDAGQLDNLRTGDARVHVVATRTADSFDLEQEWKALVET